MNPHELSVFYPEGFNRLSPDQKRPFLEKEKLREELCNFYDKYKNQTIVADLFEIGKKGQVYNLAMKSLVRSNVKIEVSMFIKYNWHWDSAGKIYIFKEEETKKRNAAHVEWKEEIAKKEELTAQVGVALTDAMNEIGKTAKAKVAEKAKTPKAPAAAKEPAKTKEKEKEKEKESAKEILIEDANKEQLIKMLEDASIPEEEYIDMNITDLREFTSKTLDKK